MMSAPGAARVAEHGLAGAAVGWYPAFEVGIGWEG